MMNEVTRSSGIRHKEKTLDEALSVTRAEELAFMIAMVSLESAATVANAMHRIQKELVFGANKNSAYCQHTWTHILGSAVGIGAALSPFIAPPLSALWPKINQIRPEMFSAISQNSQSFSSPFSSGANVWKTTAEQAAQGAAAEKQSLKQMKDEASQGREEAIRNLKQLQDAESRAKTAPAA